MSTQVPPASTRGLSRGTLIGGAIVIALVGGLLGGIIGGVIASRGSSPSTPAGVAAAGPAFCNAAAVATRAKPSLAEILASNAQGGGTGSGSVIDTNGDIITNDHVVAPGVGGRITVNLTHGATNLPAAIVGRDPLTDVAVLRVPASAGPFDAIELGSSPTLTVGQPVVALGAPLGLSETVTAGIVSALDRVVSVPSTDTTYVLLGAIQTDASINPGNSGGPLVNCDAQQVGMNSAGATLGGGSIGLGFAIPIDLAMSEAKEIIATGRVTHPSIGISGVTVTQDAASATGLPRGVLVTEVVQQGPSAGAGIMVGDVITAVGGAPVATFVDYLVAMRSQRIGDTVKISYVRGGEPHTIDVPVADGATLTFNG